jgi:hypothetical protein
MRSVAIECGLCRSARTRRPARAEVRRRLGGGESKITGAGRGGKTVPLGDQEPISCDTECGVMVEPTPVASFEMSQSQLLFQFFVIPLDDPAMFGHLYQSFELGGGRQCRYPVLGWFGIPFRPFDQQPLFRPGFVFPIIPMSRTYSNGGKARSQLSLRARSPSDFFEGRGGQLHRQLLHGDGLMVRGPLQEPRRPSYSSSWLGWQRLFAGLPHR